MYTVLLSLLVKYSGQYKRGKGKSYRFNGFVLFSSDKKLGEQLKHRLLGIIHSCMKLHDIFSFWAFIFNHLLMALLTACWLMVMWRVWLCVTSSGVFFRSCRRLRWHHLHTEALRAYSPSIFHLEATFHVRLCLTYSPQTQTCHLWMAQTPQEKMHRWSPELVWTAVNSTVNSLKHKEEAFISNNPSLITGCSGRHVTPFLVRAHTCHQRRSRMK